MNRTPRGLALLSRQSLRHRLNKDTRHWLSAGHRIQQLPSGWARGLGRYETLRDITIETGLLYEQ